MGMQVKFPLFSQILLGNLFSLVTRFRARLALRATYVIKPHLQGELLRFENA